MNTNRSPGQSQRQAQTKAYQEARELQRPTPSEGLNQNVPEDGGNDASRNRGDNNGVPRQEPPLRGEVPLRREPLNGRSDDVFDAGDTQPGAYGEVHAHAFGRN